MVESKADFARRKGWNKGTVTRAAQAGRIVLTEDGRVDVEASEARLMASRDPYKDGVRERLERERAAKGIKPTTDESLRADPNDSSYVILQKARAEGEAHKTALLSMERAEREGSLADVGEVERRAFAAAREGRNALFALQYRLDPLLAAEPDLAKRAALWDRELRAMAAQIGAACGVTKTDGGD